MTEPHAIELCLKHRDPAGFTYLVDQYRREAFYHAMNFLGNQEDAADACQDAFRKAFQAMPRLTQLDQFYPWFYRILKNHCLNLIARKKTAYNYRDLYKASQPDQDHLRPGISLETEEDKELVKLALESLKPEFREILALKYFQEQDYESIAQLLDIPRGTVMSRLYHARAAFKKAYEARKKE